MNNLLHEVKVSRPLASVVAGTSTQNGTGVDTSNFDEITFILQLGAITSTGVPALKAQQSDDDGSTDTYDDIAASNQAVADTDSGKVVILTIYRPTKKFVRPVVTRGTANAVIDSVLAILGKPRLLPTTQSADVKLSKVLAEPAEGTA